MNREERVKKIAREIQHEILSCPNEQSFDEGDTIWISGCPTDISDLLMEYNVPDNMQEEVVSMLHCPQCGSSLEIFQEVGTKHDFEREHEFTIDWAFRKHGKALYRFNEFLHKFPMQGATQPFGKTILRELKHAPRVVLQKSEWYRARISKEHGFGLAPAEYVPDQRYNSSGKTLWYFADNAQCAVAEVAPDGRAWVQQFEIPHLGGVLDLRSWHADDPKAYDEQGNYKTPHGLLIIALIYGDLLTQRNITDSLMPPDEKRKWKPEYLVSRFVAEAAGIAGFKGILCGSVRFPGENLIVFDTDWVPKSIGNADLLALDAEALKLRENFFWNQGREIILYDYP